MQTFAEKQDAHIAAVEKARVAIGDGVNIGPVHIGYGGPYWALSSTTIPCVWLRGTCTECGAVCVMRHHVYSSEDALPFHQVNHLAGAVQHNATECGGVTRDAIIGRINAKYPPELEVFE